MSLTHIPAQCPRCRSLLRVRRELLGQQVCCRYCNLVFEVSDGPGGGTVEPAKTKGQQADRADAPAKPVWLLWAARGGGTVAGAEPPQAPTNPVRPDPLPAAGNPNGGWADVLSAEAEEMIAEAEPPSPGDPTPTRADWDSLTADRDRAQADADLLAARLSVARGEVARLREALAKATAAAKSAGAARRLPVLVRDLDRWAAAAAEAMRPRIVAVPVAVGPAPLPPSLDNLAAVERHTEMLRELLKNTPPPGKPFFTLFDSDRFQAIQVKLREAQLLADRLINNVERSRSQKEMMWHLMVAQRTDELSRKKRN